MSTVFVCEGNSGPSPLAEALAKHLHPRAQVWSAGVAPSHVRPEVRAVLAERGISTVGLRAKSVHAVPMEEASLVVRIGSGLDALRPPPQARVLDWKLPDPACYPDEERLEAYRATADELERRIRTIPEEDLR